MIPVNVDWILDFASATISKCSQRAIKESPNFHPD